MSIMAQPTAHGNMITHYGLYKAVQRSCVCGSRRGLLAHNGARGLSARLIHCRAMWLWSLTVSSPWHECTVSESFPSMEWTAMREARQTRHKPMEHE